MAIAGFILAFLFPLAGIVVSIVSWAHMKKSTLKGKSLAVWGTAISALSLALSATSITMALIAFSPSS